MEITELNRQFRELQRQLRDASDTIEQLKIKLTNKSEECLEKDKEIEVEYLTNAVHVFDDYM